MPGYHLHMVRCLRNPKRTRRRARWAVVGDVVERCTGCFAPDDVRLDARLEIDLKVTDAPVASPPPVEGPELPRHIDAISVCNTEDRSILVAPVGQWQHEGRGVPRCTDAGNVFYRHWHAQRAVNVERCFPNGGSF